MCSFDLGTDNNTRSMRSHTVSATWLPSVSRRAESAKTLPSVGYRLITATGSRLMQCPTTRSTPGGATRCLTANIALAHLSYRPPVFYALFFFPQILSKPILCRNAFQIICQVTLKIAFHPSSALPLLFLHSNHK